jgi:hypothetical protein
MYRLARAALVAAILGPFQVARAQGDTVQVAGSQIPRGLFLGLNAEILRPEPEFRSYVGRPTGIGGHVTIPVWTLGSTSLGIRTDAFWVRHFHKDLTSAVAVDREFYGGLIGPQIALATGPVRPYIAAGYGTTRYWTGVRVDEDCEVDVDPGCESLDRVRGSDYEASTVLTAGTHIRLGGPASVALLLHVAASYHRGGTPDVRTLQDGTTPGRPDVRYRSFQIGLSIGGR